MLVAQKAMVSASLCFQTCLDPPRMEPMRAPTVDKATNIGMIMANGPRAFLAKS